MKKKSRCIIIINNHTLEKNNTKYLGIIIDNKFTWKAYIHSLKRNIFKSCYALYIFKIYANLEACVL